VNKSVKQAKIPNSVGVAYLITGNYYGVFKTNDYPHDTTQLKMNVEK